MELVDTTALTNPENSAEFKKLIKSTLMGLGNYASSTTDQIKLLTSTLAKAEVAVTTANQRITTLETGTNVLKHMGGKGGTYRKKASENRAIM